MSTPKPLVQVACVCEKVLTEHDNVPSLIRIVDTYTLHVPPGQSPSDSAVSLTAFVALKSGEVVGEYEAGLRLVPPDGKATQVRKWPVVLNGSEHGVNLKIEFVIPSPTPGLYWFDVLWGEDVLTRIPFRLKTSPAATAPSVLPTEHTTQTR